MGTDEVGLVLRGGAVEGILGRSCCAEGSGAASFGLPQMFPMAECAEREVDDVEMRRRRRRRRMGG